MKLSARQIAMLHWVPGRLGIDDAQRRIIQRNVGGFHSASDRTVTRQGFQAVMAHYEDRYPGRRIPGFTPGYWRGQADRSDPGDSLRYAIRRLAYRMGWSERQLSLWVAGPHMTDGAYGGLDGAPVYWLRRIRDGLQAIARREGVEVSR